ncbi:hypothetical protein JCM16303_007133 [Sporobolomyces ruberrimus]
MESQHAHQAYRYRPLPPSHPHKPPSTSPTRSIPYCEEGAIDETQQQYLPTPTSLPNPHLLIGSGSGSVSEIISQTSDEPSSVISTTYMEANERAREQSEGSSDSETRLDSANGGRGGAEVENGLPFEIEIDMEVEELDTMEIEDHRGRYEQASNREYSIATLSEAPFSSSHRPLRTTRARYASSGSEASLASPLQDPQAATHATDESAPSHKRTFSHVSISTGMTPPALPTPAFDGSSAFAASPPLSPRLESGSPGSPNFPSLELPLPSSSPLSIDIEQHPLFSSAPLVVGPRPLPPQSRARTHSFESQRASTVRASGRRNLLEVARESFEGGESSRSSSLRRRSPALGGGEGEGRDREGSKRRRASTLLPGDTQVVEPSTLTSTHQGSQSFAPAFGRYPAQSQPVEPVLSWTSTGQSNDHQEGSQVRSRHRVGFGLGRGGLSLSRPFAANLAPRSPDTQDRSAAPGERRTTSRHSFSRLPPWWRTNSFSQSATDRPSPPSVSDNLAIGTSTSFLPTPPLTLPSPSFPLRTSRTGEALSTFSHDETLHSERSIQFQRRGEAILREAEETLRSREALLRDAEESARRARQLLSEDREDRERERRINGLPDVGGLPEPAELSARPVIGLRIGEGWPATSQTSTIPAGVPAARGRRTSIFSAISPPPSPDEDSLASGGTSSRTRQFLTSLRSRRPRFSRNSTGTTPPESNSPTLADTLLDSTYDVEAERRAATELNERLLERRRISASLEPPSLGVPTEGRQGLWGETLDRTSRSRVRGPTEVQNERWRLGQAPSLAGGTTTPALVATTSTSTANRLVLSSGILTPLNGSDSAATVTNPLEISNNATDSAAVSYFSRRDDSPSLQRRSRATGFRRSTLNERGGVLNSEDPSHLASHGERDPTGLSTEDDRLSFRMPLSSAQSETAASTARSRLRFDTEEEDDAGLQTGRSRWNPPHLPLMLPSGSEGRRMMFPHPANAAGMSDSLEAAEEGGAAGARDGHESSEFARRWSGTFGSDPLGHSSFNPFGDLPPALVTTSTADAMTRLAASDSAANSRNVPPSVSLASTLSVHGNRETPDDPNPSGSRLATTRANPTLRRRHYGSLPNPVEDPPFPTLERVQDSVDAVAERLAQHRVERLASLRRERTFMRGILGGASPSGETSGGGGVSATGPTENPDRLAWRDRARDSLDLERERRSQAASPPRSPGFRRRGLGEFFRGFGTGGRLISIFDEEYGAFFGRDAVALDSRNYLEDDEFDASYEGLLRLSAQIGDVKPKGVSEDAMATLRTFPYSKWPYIEHESASKTESPIASTSANQLELVKPEFARKNIEKEARCAICLSDYEDQDEIALGRCSHGFHSDCLKAWLKDHGSCPVCRRDHTTPA